MSDNRYYVNQSAEPPEPPLQTMLQYDWVLLVRLIPSAAESR